MNENQSNMGAVAEICYLGLHAARVTRTLVGRPIELAAVEQELTSARSGMVCITVEGEPGIGKTRFLLAVEELTRSEGFTPVAVTADEEIRGPFLIARSIFAAPSLSEIATGTRAERPMQRLIDVLGGRDDPGLQNLPPESKLLRIFDLAAVAVSALAAEKPVAILVDDLQWADDDSLRLLRYIVRASTSSPVLFVLGMRPDEMADANEALKLVADMERMGLMRRLKLGRFSQLESIEFLQQAIGGKVDPSTGATMHAQAEGVPFILAEQVRAYREAGLIQEMDGVWTLARNAERLLPSAVRTLIQRRAAHLPEETNAALAEAAVLGRAFSLRDLHDVKARLGEAGNEVDTLAETLEPAVTAGLLTQLPAGSPADFSFTHNQVREFALASLSAARRRTLHGTIVDLLTAGGEPAPASLPLLAQHAFAAGQAERCAHFAIEGARSALASRAPEEVLRLVDLAHPVASTSADRIALLSLRDDALNMLHRSNQRLEGLAELGALAEALGDTHLELDVMLRRAAALRLSKEHDFAADLARRVRARAVEAGDGKAELAACLELGQDLLRVEIGDGYILASTEADLDGAEEAYKCAAALAEAAHEELRLADATRELGVISASRLRTWVVERIQAGEHVEILRRIADGEKLADILPTLPVAPLFMEAHDRYLRALELYEHGGDRSGAMASIIALAYLDWGPEIHLTGSALRIEEIRRLSSRRSGLMKESERAQADAQLLFGAHVYSRAKVFPDVALAKGEEAYNAARTIADRVIEFAAAGGLAATYAELADIENAGRWLERAAAVATGAPTPLRARQLESWRGIVAAAAGDAAGLKEHLQRAVRLATEQGQPVARCEALARLALEAARLGRERHDEDLLAIAEQAAREAKALAPLLPGHPVWGAQGDSAEALVAMARGDTEAAAAFGRAALDRLAASIREDLVLEIFLPAAAAVLETAGPTEAEAVRDQLHITLGLVTQRITDEDVRVRWFRAPLGRELTRLAGPLGPVAPVTSEETIADGDTSLLRLLAEGRTNQEIAEELEESESSIARRLGELYVKIGASSRADATAVALRTRLA